MTQKLKQALNYAVDIGLLELSPITRVKRLPVDNRRVKFLSLDDFRRILHEARNTDAYDLFLTIGLTGLRPSNVRLLSVDEVDGDIIRIPPEKMKTDVGESSRLHPPCRASCRPVRRLLTSFPLVVDTTARRAWTTSHGATEGSRVAWTVSSGRRSTTCDTSSPPAGKARRDGATDRAVAVPRRADRHESLRASRHRRPAPLRRGPRGACCCGLWRRLVRLRRGLPPPCFRALLRHALALALVAVVVVVGAGRARAKVGLQTSRACGDFPVPR